MSTAADLLDAWPAFADGVRRRLETTRAVYGDTSFARPPAELFAELQQEALDLAGWGFVLWRRLEAMRTFASHALVHARPGDAVAYVAVSPDGHIRAGSALTALQASQNPADLTG